MNLTLPPRVSAAKFEQALKAFEGVVGKGWVLACRRTPFTLRPWRIDVRVGVAILGACHLAGGMGTNLLTKQRMAAGESPESGLLANRKDLTQTYVKAIVRHGRLAMPRLTRVEVTDAELDSIAKYLGKAGP